MLITFKDSQALPGVLATVSEQSGSKDDNFNSLTEFGDGTVTSSLWEMIDQKMAVLHVAAYRTTNGIQVPDKILTLQRQDGHWKVMTARAA